jgi:dihydrofolate synthase/folylpolyglutamate synthase
VAAIPLTLADWLARLEAAHPRQIDLGLERVRVVAERLDLARSSVPVYTVGGTNGKGSCVAVIDRLLGASGIRTGCYTSPHLRRYNERVRIAGVEADDEALCRAFAAVEAARGEVSLTYFEHGTLAALHLFREADVERLVLEVGLGGCLDAVNLLDADVAVVTSIGLDHQDWLGPDRESIGREKAGIFRAGRPAVVGDSDPPASLRHVAATVGAHWLGIGEAFSAQTLPDGRWAWSGRSPSGAALGVGPIPAPALMGSNVACALQALAIGGDIPAPSLVEALLPRIRVEGRMQGLRCQGIDCLLDVAHNPEGIAALRARLAADPPRGCERVVMGAMRDKDFAGMIAALAPHVAEWFLADLPLERAAAATELDAALPPGAQGHCFEDLSGALEAAISCASPGDRVLVCGSFHVVGPALSWFEARAEAGGEGT